MPRLTDDARAEQAHTIVDSAAQLYSDRGIQEVTVGEIAVDAGLGFAALHVHFPRGRLHVLEAVAEHTLDRMLKRVRESAPSIDGLAAILSGEVDDVPPLLLLELALLVSREQRGHAAVAGRLERLRDALAKVCRDGESDGYAEADALLGATYAAALHRHDESAADRTRAIATIACAFIARTTP